MSTAAMTVQHVAKDLNVDPKTVNRGSSPASRFHKDDIEDWIAKQKAAAANKEGDDR